MYKVIGDHHSKGHPGAYLIRATLGGHSPDLLGACCELLLSPEGQATTEQAVRDFPQLLTLEDMMAAHGHEWGVPEAALHQARANVQRLDAAVGFQRYVI